MEECYICGQPAYGEGLVEGARVPLCQRDLQYGKSVKVAAPAPAVSKPSSSKSFPSQASAPPAPRGPYQPRHYSVAEEYPELVAQARQKLGWTRLKLAQETFLMENVLERIEHGHLTPDLKTAQKLEKALGIRLVEEEKPAEAQPKDKGAAKKAAAEDDEPTMADLVDVKVKE